MDYSSIFNPGAALALADAESVPAVAEAPPLAEHLVGLPGSRGEWALWRSVALRGTGFPADGVLGLAARGASAAADALLEAEEAAGAACRAAKELVNASLDALRERGGWETEKEARKAHLAATRALEKGRAPEPMGDPAIDAALDAARAALARLAEAAEAYAPAFEEGQATVSGRIREVAGDPWFQEAVLWQNRQAVHTALRKLTADEAGASRNSQRRQHEELVASYVQRYCLKNDSIGFFGPVGWATLDDRDRATHIVPGPGLLARRTVYLESWCVHALAETFTRNRALRRWMTPERLPFVRVEGTMLHLPNQRPTPLPAPHAALLAACDGTGSALEVAAALLAAGSFRSEREVLLALERLHAMNLLVWSFRVPIAPGSERTLRRILEGLGDEAEQRRGLDALDRLEAAVDAVARAAGDVEALDAAIMAMEEEFSRATGVEATRSGGRTYAARTPVYEDCRRDADVRLGGDFMDELGPTLTLLLQSARWYTNNVAARYRAAFDRVYDELVAETGSPVVDAVRFWYRAQPLLFEQGTLLDDVAAEYQARWSSILGVPAEGRRVQLALADVRARVEEEFAAPGPGWAGCRYHSPDVMVAAPGPHALAEGDLLFVLGEIHVAINTLNQWVFMAQHPDLEAAGRWMDHDLPEARVLPVAPRSWPTLTTRTQVAHVSPKDYSLASSHGAADVSRARPLSLASLSIERVDGGLVSRTADGGLCFDIVETFADVLAYMVNDGFRLLPRAPHTPRVTVDRMVLCRESWSFPVADLAFANEKEGRDRLLGARRWAREHGLPRFVFVKCAVEKKPFYLDLESPIYTDLFCKVLRRAQTSELAGRPVTIAEMLPTPEMAWLPDAQGRRYASELRVLAVDQAKPTTRHWAIRPEAAPC